jgi:hypothetical protein
MGNHLQQIQAQSEARGSSGGRAAEPPNSRSGIIWLCPSPLISVLSERLGVTVRCSDLLYAAYGGEQKQLVHFEGDHNSEHHVLTFRARDLLTAIFKMHRCVVWETGVVRLGRSPGSG